MCKRVIIAFGGNLPSASGPPAATISAALKVLSTEGLNLRKVSKFYKTPSFPEGSGPDFVNAVALVETTLSPRQLLSVLNAVEDQFGRQRAKRWGQRTLDLDLLAMDQVVLPNPEIVTAWMQLSVEEQQRRTPSDLVLPHPRIQDRAFVLGPLCDVAPDWNHPILGKSALQLYDALPDVDKAQLQPIAP